MTPSGKQYQSIALIFPEEKNVKSSINISSDYSDKMPVKFVKINQDGEQVGDAVIGIFASDDTKIAEFTSTSIESNNVFEYQLEVGDYYLKELEAPALYILNTQKVPFSVVPDATGHIVVKQNGNVAQDGIIKLQDNYKKVKFRKLDENGNPLGGVRIEIGDFNNKVLNEESMANYLFVCAITDNEGYLTRPCTDLPSNLNPEKYYDPDGEYLEQLFPTRKTMIANEKYYIHENFKSGYFNKTFSDYVQDFYFDNGSGDIAKGWYVQASANDIQLEENDSLIEITLTNSRFLNIKKTDVTTGKEVEGAKLVVYDKEIKKYSQDENGENVELPFIVDEWTSGATGSHQINGIKANHRYILSETIAPDGYLKMTTDIEFEMDKDGNVTTYDSKGKVIKDLKGTNYELIITNDYTKVTISKTDMVTSEEVPGAKIKLCTLEEYNKLSNNCKSFEEWTSGKEPHQINRLAVGKYCLIETIAPKGYAKKTSAVCFEVKEQSGIQQVEFTNQPIKMVVSKKNQITGERVSGATLQILNAKDRTGAKTNTGAELVWVSNDKSDWEITGIPVGDYILVEKITPEGYQEGMVIDGETVQEYAFSITGKEDVDIELYVPVLNAPNTGLSTLNLFAIGALLVFTGYETIKIYRKKRVNE